MKWTIIVFVVLEEADDVGNDTDDVLIRNKQEFFKNSMWNRFL